MDLQNNERIEEWLLIIGDWLRETPKSWYYALVGMVVVALPLYMFLNLIFEKILINSITPIKINYEEVSKVPLTVTEKKIFSLGDGTYSGYVRVKNPNADWGVPKQGYRVEFKSATGATLLSNSAETFILPANDKIIVFPRFSASSEPKTLDFTLSEAIFIRPRSIPTLNLEIQRRSLDAQAAQTLVNAVIVNHTPFKISRVDLPVLLFDGANQVIGVNYTNINDLNYAESRSFQYTWFSHLNNVARIEIIPEVNIYARDIFGAAPGTNPFGDNPE